MEFKVSEENGTAIVSTNVQRLNSTNAAELKAELVLLNKKGVNNIIIDMSATKFCDSSGLSSILIANRLCKDTNGRFILCGLQANVQKLIEIAQLDKVLNITDSKENALASLAQ